MGVNLRLLALLMLFFLLISGCGAGCSCSGQNQRIPESDSVSSQKHENDEKFKDSDTIEAPDLIAAGRAVELGNDTLALDILGKGMRTSGKARYLAALAFAGRKDYVSVVDILSGEYVLTHSELQHEAMILLIDAHIKLGHHREAIARLDGLLAKPHLSKGEQRDLLEKQGDCYFKTDEYAKAATSFEQAGKWAGPKKLEKLSVKMAEALIADGRRDDAARILTPLALFAKQKRVMNQAYALLKTNDLLPNWSRQELLGRTEKLMANKSWDEALSSIKQLEKMGGEAFSKQLRWMRARILFKRRGHYKEALPVLAEVVADGAPYAEEAAFLSARALARIDHDDEAIVAFRAFARTAKNKSRVDEARFHAARLEFYLGRHGAAFKSFKALVGNGKKRIRTALDGGTERDALFLAGMSGFLLKRYTEAQLLFEAASEGSGSAEAMLRNQYWAAVSLLNRTKAAGQSDLEKVCETDATSWYALFAAIRLHDAGLTSSICSLYLPELRTNADEPVKQNDSDAGETAMADTSVKTMSLSPHVTLAEISSKAALYASMGLYRPASEALNQVEKSNKATASRQDFILHYLQLDAPQYAIRNASIGLDFEKRDGDFEWLAKTAYPVPYLKLVKAEEKRHSLPPFLIYAIARKESLFDPFAVSYVGAMGMMQMMPATYESNRKKAGLPKLAEGALPSAAESIVAGGFELAHLLDKFNGSLPLAIMGYNGGARAVDRWLERSGEFSMDVFVEKAGFAQTRNYVRRVYQNLVRYAQLYNGPLPPLPRQAQPDASGRAKKKI